MIAIIDIDADGGPDGFRDCSTVRVHGYTWRDLLGMRRFGLDLERGELGEVLVVGAPTEFRRHWTESAEIALGALGAEIRK